jgi:hypothetical protein
MAGSRRSTLPNPLYNSETILRTSHLFHNRWEVSCFSEGDCRKVYLTRHVEGGLAEKVCGPTGDAQVLKRA